MATAKKNQQKNTEAPNANKECEDVARELIRKLEKQDSESNITREGEPDLTRTQIEIYREALKIMNDLGVPYAVGAAFARHAYTNIWRPTKDIDLFVRADDLRNVLETFQTAGFDTEIREQHWLAKAWRKGYFVDFIFGTGHGKIPVTGEVLQGSRPAEVVGVPTFLIPIEEMIAANCYIKERNRYDAPDTIHLIRSSRGRINWQRVLDRLGENRELLLMDLLLFDFIYPGHGNYLPKELMVTLFEEVRQSWDEKEPRRAFRGSLLDPFSYSVDVVDWGYEDRRDTTPLVDQRGEQL